MRFGKVFAILAAFGFVVGCADAVPDDAETTSDQDDYETVGETDSSGEKADNIGGREVAWKSTDTVELEGTTHEGTAEIVATDPKVRIKTSGIEVSVDEYPVNIDISAAEGLISTKKMNFVIYARKDGASDWTQLEFVSRDKRRKCTCQCGRMSGTPDKCYEEYTVEHNYWRYKSMDIENDVIQTEEGTFNSQLEGIESFDLRIVPLPYGKIGDMEGTYDYELNVECFGGQCGADDGEWKSN